MSAVAPMETSAVDPSIAKWQTRLDNVCKLAKRDPSRLDCFLYEAVGSGPVEAVEGAIIKGAKLCFLEDFGETALHLAMRIGNVAKVTLLLTNFSNFTTRDVENQTVKNRLINLTRRGDDEPAQCRRLFDVASEKKCNQILKRDPNFKP